MTTLALRGGLGLPFPLPTCWPHPLPLARSFSMATPQGGPRESRSAEAHPGAGPLLGQGGMRDPPAWPGQTAHLGVCFCSGAFSAHTLSQRPAHWGCFCSLALRPSSQAVTSSAEGSWHPERACLLPPSPSIPAPPPGTQKSLDWPGDGFPQSRSLSPLTSP